MPLLAGGWGAANQNTGPVFASQGIIRPNWRVAAWTESRTGELNIQYAPLEGLVARQRYRFLTDQPVIE